MGGLGKTIAAVGVGFIAAQASIAGVQKIMSASIGAAMAYEAQMAEIRALTGATEKDTDFLTVAIKDMAREMPKSPAELGSAAYFILSSGIEDAADAADVLNVAARASTIGLGETQSVANALTTVLNAYGMEAGKAGHVTDIMIEAVKQGKAEASEFAGVLGRVVPLAAQMGISFEEVAANLATFTRLGVSAEEAATGLRQVMAGLLKPTTDQEEAMAELGMSAEGLRQQIKEKGLLVTLDAMMKATGGNEAAISRLFPNIRALISVLGTAGVQMEGYKDILGATNSATGNLDEGFGIVADTAKFKMGVAMNELNLMLMELGEEILPAIVPAARAVVFAVETLAEAMGPLVLAIELIGAAFDKLPSKEELVKQKLIDLAANADVTKEEFIKLAEEGIGLTSTEAKKLASDTAFSTQMEVWRQKALDAGMSVEEVSKQLAKMGIHLFDTGEMADRMAERHAEAAEEIERAARDKIVPSLEAVAEKADDARSALTSMFRETTAEEAGAEAALANLKLEMGRLEAKTDDLTAAEAARLAKLNDELIPAQQDSLDLLRLEKDAVEAHALAQTNAGPSMEEWRRNIDQQVNSVSALDTHLRNLPKEIPIKVSLGVGDFSYEQVAQMIGPNYANVIFGIGAQHGFHGDVTRPTLFLAGEGSRRERVDITPGGGGGQTGGRTVNLHIHFDGPILGDHRQAMQLVEFIRPELERTLV